MALPPPCPPHYISCPGASAARGVLLCAGAWMEAQLVFWRDEEEPVSPLLSDTTDDRNINGPRRAEQHSEEVAQQHRREEHKLAAFEKEEIRNSAI